MPFKSTSQRRACWAQYNKAKRAGQKPKWDCKEWEAATPKGTLPYLKAKMPRADDILTAQQDLLKYNREELKTLADKYNLPGSLGKQDLCWMIALHNFLDK